MIGLWIVIIYLNVGAFVSERNALDIAAANPPDPDKDLVWQALRLIIWYTLTWPWWVFRGR
jgi:hypothetical protein